MCISIHRNVEIRFKQSTNIWTLLWFFQTKMKDETGGVAIEEFIWLKPNMYSFLVDNNKHKKA